LRFRAALLPVELSLTSREEGAVHLAASSAREGDGNADGSRIVRISRHLSVRRATLRGVGLQFAGGAELYLAASDPRRISRVFRVVVLSAAK